MNHSAAKNLPAPLSLILSGGGSIPPEALRLGVGSAPDRIRTCDLRFIEGVHAGAQGNRRSIQLSYEGVF